METPTWYLLESLLQDLSVALNSVSPIPSKLRRFLHHAMMINFQSSLYPVTENSY